MNNIKFNKMEFESLLTEMTSMVLENGLQPIELVVDQKYIDQVYGYFKGRVSEFLLPIIHKRVPVKIVTDGSFYVKSKRK